MNQNPKNNHNDNEPEMNEVKVECIPLTVLISGIANTSDIFNIIFKLAEILVVFVATYLILGRVLFTALVVTPLLVGVVYNMIAAWEVVSYSNEDFSWDCEFHDDDDENDDRHFKKK